MFYFHVKFDFGWLLVVVAFVRSKLLALNKLKISEGNDALSFR